MYTIEHFNINNRAGWLVGLPRLTVTKPIITKDNSLQYETEYTIDNIPANKFLLHCEHGTMVLSGFSKETVEIMGWLGTEDISYPELSKVFSDDEECQEELMSLFDDLYPSQRVLLIIMK